MRTKFIAVVVLIAATIGAGQVSPAAARAGRKDAAHGTPFTITISGTLSVADDAHYDDGETDTPLSTADVIDLLANDAADHVQPDEYLHGVTTSNVVLRYGDTRLRVEIVGDQAYLLDEDGNRVDG